MRTIFFILRKEFRQIFRDKAMLFIIFFVPVVQLVVLAYAATFEIKNGRMIIVDNDCSTASRELISSFNGSSFFIVKDVVENSSQNSDFLKKNQADIILTIESGFEKKIIRNENTSLLIVSDAINGVSAGLLTGYANAIIADFSQNRANQNQSFVPPVKISPRYWYNPELNYKYYMVPGILVVLVSLIGMFLTAMNIVKEKEIGTIEQINATPIRKSQFIIGKLLPFWIIAFFDLLFGLLIAKLLFALPFEGSFILFLCVVAIYLLAVLGIGLFISTLADNMKQAMFIAWFFLVIFILLGGLFTPAESMPDWTQELNRLNPIAYFIKISRMIMLKGATFANIADSFYALLIYAAVMLGLSVFRYRKTT